MPPFGVDVPTLPFAMFRQTKYQLTAAALAKSFPKHPNNPTNK